jgi:hypothetical protein
MKTCKCCNKQVIPRKKYGIGTLIGVLVTSGLWIFVMPFYPDVCYHCGSNSFA